jgi:putative membrane protein
MKKLVLAAALLALAAPAYAQTASPAAPGQKSADQGSVSAETKTFVTTAAMTDMFEIQAGQLAQKKADGPAYQDFAQMTVADHTKTSQELKPMAASLRGVQLPVDLDSAHKQKIDQLGSLSGAAFERQYKTIQVAGHKQAIELFENYAKSGDNPELKSWAARTLPTLKTHLQHAEALPSAQPAPTTGSGMKSK